MNNAMRNMNQRSLRYESLEARTLLAGDVAAMLHADGTLELTGDKLDNEISIEALGEGGVRIEGLGDTTVGGQASVEFSEVTALAVQTRQGDDVVRIDGLQVSVSVETDAGSDTVVFAASVRESLHIDTGRGGGERAGDQVILELQAGSLGDTTILSHEGNDLITVDVSQAPFGNMLIDAGGGDDEVDVAGSRLPFDERLQILTRSGDDRVTLSNLWIRTGRAEIDSGSGRDLVTLRDLALSEVYQQLVIQTGSGNDHVRFEAAIAAPLIFLDCGSGDDHVTIDSDSQFFLTGDAGTGWDTLELLNSSALIDMVFEEVIVW